MPARRPSTELDLWFRQETNIWHITTVPQGAQVPQVPKVPQDVETWVDLEVSTTQAIDLLLHCQANVNAEYAKAF